MPMIVSVLRKRSQEAARGACPELVPKLTKAAWTLSFSRGLASRAGFLDAEVRRKGHA